MDVKVRPINLITKLSAIWDFDKPSYRKITENQKKEGKNDLTPWENFLYVSLLFSLGGMTSSFVDQGFNQILRTLENPGPIFNLCFDFGKELILDFLDKSNIIFTNSKLPIVSRLLEINVTARVVAADEDRESDEDGSRNGDAVEEEEEIRVGGGNVQKGSARKALPAASAPKRGRAKHDYEETTDPPAKPIKKLRARKKKKKVEEVEGWVEKDLTGDDEYER